MPLWAARTLVVLLFFAVMAGVSAVLKVVVPWVLDPVGNSIGWWPTFGLLTLILLPCGIYGFWPRDPAGRMRPLLPRRR